MSTLAVSMLVNALNTCCTALNAIYQDHHQECCLFAATQDEAGTDDKTPHAQLPGLAREKDFCSTAKPKNETQIERRIHWVQITISVQWE